jgi:Meiotically Up-regulated Gene 113 (MUG113) protein
MAYVYILRSGSENLFKIGRTDRDVDARIRQLATGNPHRLTKFDCIETEHDSLCETYLHRILRSRKSLASDDGLDGIATWRTQAVERLDQAALKAAQPDIFKMYSKTSRMRVLRLD